jgi:predicted RNA-binding protein with PUA-like domain
MKTQYWLVKQEPETYAWEDFVLEGGTSWEGVRNYQARNFLKTMAPRDRVLFYASGAIKAVVGIAEVVGAPFPDPTAVEPGWFTIRLRPVGPLSHPVSLARIKAVPDLAKIGLVRQSRLSVMPLAPSEFERIVALGNRP